MAEDPDEPRFDRSEHLRALEREDLDLYSLGDLDERTRRLRAEIERIDAKKAAKQSGLSAADALFKF
jgi:uncharacterized small protein (DUF1192 family)